MINKALYDQIKRNRSKMLKGARRASYRKRIKIKYPIRAETALANKSEIAIRGIANAMIQYLKEHKPLYQVFVDRMRRDSFESQFNIFIDGLLRNVDEEFRDGKIHGVAVATFLATILSITKSFVDKEIETFLVERYGAYYPLNDGWYDDLKRRFEIEYAERLRALVKDYIVWVKTTVLSDVGKQMDYNKVLEYIEAKNKVVLQRWTKNMARDMIGKLNGKILREKQTNMGFEEYIWSSSLDERTRGASNPVGLYKNAKHDHYMMGNTICKWYDPTVYSVDGGRTFVQRPDKAFIGDPGQDWGCRCTATPYDSAILKKIDAEIDKEKRGV